MTNEEIEKLESGRELDAMVAEKVMGDVFQEGHWLSRADEQGRRVLLGEHPVPYSVRISSAEEVINKLREHYAVQIMYWPNMVELTLYNPSATKLLSSTRSSTAPLAICRAALKAVSPSP